MQVRAEVGFVIGRSVRAGRDDFVDALEFPLGKLQVERLQIVLELLERARADDGTCDTGLMEDPCECKV